MPILLLTGALAHAQALTVPAAYDAADGPSLGFLAGITMRGRQQILIDAPLLVPLVGRTIDGLWFRRDGNTREPLPGGATSLKVKLSQDARRPDLAERSFARNHGVAPVLVVAGQVRIPWSPGPGQDRWALDQTVRIAFTTPFAYVSGPLCIELDSGDAGPATGKWPVDCARQPLDSATRSLGKHCSKAARMPPGDSLFVSRERLTLGASTVFGWLGRGSTPAILMLGTEEPVATDLSANGMTGCLLWLQPRVSLLTSFGPADPQSDFGVANLELQVPLAAELLGGRLCVQGANVETAAQKSNPAGVTLSQGLAVTLARGLVPLGLALVDCPALDLSDPLPDEGQVVPNRAPVLRLTYR